MSTELSRSRRSSSGRRATAARFWRSHSLTHSTSIAKTTWELLAAAKLLNEWQSVGTNSSLIINVCHSSHQRTQYHLRVILKEIDLTTASTHLQDVITFLTNSLHQTTEMCMQFKYHFHVYDDFCSHPQSWTFLIYSAIRCVMHRTFPQCTNCNSAKSMTCTSLS